MNNTPTSPGTNPMPQLTHSRYSMKRNMRVLTGIVLGITLLATIVLHILISIQNNTIEDINGQIARADVAMATIREDARFMTYQRNNTFLSQLSILPYTSYLRELFSITQAPFSLTGVQLAEQGSGTGSQSVGGKIDINGPEDLGLVSSYLGRVKSSPFFSIPYISSISGSRTSEGNAQYSFPITLQLTRFSNEK